VRPPGPGPRRGRRGLPYEVGTGIPPAHT